MKTFVDNSNFLEFVSEVTDQIVQERFGNDGYVELGNGETRYIDEAQDFFNCKYDEVESMLNKILGVHSNIENELVN